MNRTYLSAGAVALLGVVLAVASIARPDSVGFAGLMLAATAVPAAIMLVMVERLDSKVPVAALVAGGTLAIAISVIGYALVGGIAYFVLGGFAGWLLDSSDGVLDTALMETLRDPWMIVLVIQVVVLAPLIEEFAKVVSSLFSRPHDRVSAMMAGAAAGVGFAVIENIAYATAWLYDIDGWEIVVLMRMLGSAVHPLATGLAALGWWEFRNGVDRASGTRLIAAGAGVHALWNGAVMAVFVASAAFGGDATPLESVLVTMGYAGVLGIVVAIGGWQALNRVADGDLPGASVDPRDGRTMTAWVVIASTMLIPAIVVVFALSSSTSL